MEEEICGAALKDLFTCDLYKGHEGTHRNAFKHREKWVIVTWETDDREKCSGCDEFKAEININGECDICFKIFCKECVDNGLLKKDKHLDYFCKDCCTEEKVIEYKKKMYESDWKPFYDPEVLK